MTYAAKPWNYPNVTLAYRKGNAPKRLLYISDRRVKKFWTKIRRLGLNDSLAALQTVVPAGPVEKFLLEHELYVSMLYSDY